MMSRKLIVLLSAMIVFCLMAVPVSAKATKHKNITEELKAKTLSQRYVKIKWKKHKVDKYIIYKYVYSKNGSEKKKKLKTVSGKKTSVVIKAKKNEELELYIKGVKKSKKIQYEGEINCWTGLSTPFWDEYCFAESPCSPSYVTLDFYAYGGQKPSGYQIYRKVKGAKKFKRIKTIKAKKRHLVWKDKTVKTGKAYVYKIRSFHGSGKKKYYSKKSDAETLYAVNFNGKFTIASEENGDQIIIKLTSDAKNGKTEIRPGILAESLFSTEDPTFRYPVKAYSLDGQQWIDVKADSDEEDEKYVEFDAGDSIWLRTERTEYKTMRGDDDWTGYWEGSMYTDWDEEVDGEWDPDWKGEWNGDWDGFCDVKPYVLELVLYYRDVPCILNIPVFEDTAKTYLYAEAIH